MSENKPEQQNNPPRKEVQLRKWFKPFENYSSTPGQDEGDGIFTKTFYFEVPGIGKLNIELLNWQQSYQEDEEAGIKQLPETTWGIIPLADKDVIIDYPSQTYQQQKDGEKILRRLNLRKPAPSPEVLGDDLTFTDMNFIINIRFPSGREGFLDLSRKKNSMNGTPPHDWFFTKHDKPIDNIYVPDNSYIAEQIGVMIEKSGGEK